MAEGKARDERKESQWRRWLVDWRGSGLSVRAFCARRGLSEPCFYGWRNSHGASSHFPSGGLLKGYPGTAPI
jgi:hypothetical protein